MVHSSFLNAVRTGATIAFVVLAAPVLIGCARSSAIGQDDSRVAAGSGPVAVAVPGEVITPGWNRSYRSGDIDSSGRVAAGSEILHLVGHKGKLYAAASFWMDP